MTDSPPPLAQPISGTENDSPSGEAGRPVLRVVSGNPSAEELAALTAIVSAAVAGEEPTAPVRHGRWNDPAMLVRRPLVPGPGAWQAAVR